MRIFPVIIQRYWSQQQSPYWVLCYYSLLKKYIIIMNPEQAALTLIGEYIQADQDQEQRLLQLLTLSKELSTEQRLKCIEQINKLGGPCNHYFDLADAIRGTES